MKILITTGLFYPSKLGGPANTLYWLAKALVKKGVDVTVITSYNHIEDNTIPFDQWTDLNEIKVLYCVGSATLSRKQIHIAKKELKTCDVLMLSSVCTMNNFIIGLLAKYYGKKIIWSPRGEFFDSAIQVGSRLKKGYFHLLTLFFGRYVTFHATSEREKQTIQKVLGSNTKVVILPNYIEVPEKLTRKDSLGPYIVYVGRIAPIKALDNILEGLAKSGLFMSSSYKFIIVGSVEEKFKPFYEHLVELRKGLGLIEKVEFVGPKFGSDKFQLYADASFSLLLSKSENFGNVVIEALSQGTPVIASKGTPWQVLENRKAGLWIDNSPESIAACLDEVLSMEEFVYDSMRINALKLVGEFDVSKNIHKWVGTLKNL